MADVSIEPDLRRVVVWHAIQTCMGGAFVFSGICRIFTPNEALGWIAALAGACVGLAIHIEERPPQR